MSDELKPCPMCGGPVEINAGAAAECYGKAWQTISIECLDEQDKHCGMHLSMHADFYYAPHAWHKLIELWNEL